LGAFWLKCGRKIKVENLVLFGLNENRIKTVVEKDCVKIQSAVLICAVTLFAFLGEATYRKAHPCRSDTSAAVVVEVKGEGVTQPGLYILVGSGATVGAAAARGGLRHGIPEPLASRKIFCGQSVEIDGGKAGVGIKLARMPGAALLACGLKLDLNTASLDDLLLIPHLRPSIAEAIVKRRSRKAWAAIEDLVEIRGVGPKTMEKLRDYLELSSREVAGGDERK
jgi:hypothetical protein